MQSQDNAVNQVVSYHLLPFMAPLDKLFHSSISYDKFANPAYLINQWDFTRPMGKLNHILKIIETGADSIFHLNRQCSYDNGFNGTYKETSCDYEGPLTVVAIWTIWRPTAISTPLTMCCSTQTMCAMWS